MKIVLLIVSLAIGEIIAARPRRSIGGAPISIEEAPYFVSITRHNRHICGGTLITQKHVLSAARCFITVIRDYSEMTVVTGTDRRDEGRTSHKIKKIYPHRKYSYTLDAMSRPNDIAVIKLAKSIQITDKQKPIDWPNQDPVYWRQASLIAFQSDNPEKGDPLHTLEIDMAPIHICMKHYSNGIIGQSTIFCAKNYARHGMFIDDAGSPVVDNGKLVGIASFLDRSDQMIDVFTNVYAYMDFIKKTTKCQNSLCVIT